MPRDGTLLGGLFEVARHPLGSYLPQSLDARTYSPAQPGWAAIEVDLIVETGDGVIGIEVKLGASPTTTTSGTSCGSANGLATTFLTPWSSRPDPTPTGDVTESLSFPLALLGP